MQESARQSNLQLRSAEATAAQAGFRADRALGALAPELNRRAAKALFRGRLVRINGRIVTGAERVAAGDRFEFPEPTAQNIADTARAPRLTTPHGRHLLRLYEDDAVLVISKPAEIPVHRGQGGYTRRDTLEDVLGKAYPPPDPSPPTPLPQGERGARKVPRQGYYFVHRLDMETSGCLLIAKSEAARDALIRDFSARKVHKEYLAVVSGEVAWKQLVVRKPLAYVRADSPSGNRNRPLRAVKKAVTLDEDAEEGKASETHFEVLRRFKGCALLRAVPKTGRTHQIRAHLKAIGHALAYDPLYGRVSPLRRREFDLRSTGTEKGEQVVLNRIPLHAWKLRFTHPVTGETIRAEAPLPRDLREFLALLKKFRSKH